MVGLPKNLANCFCNISVEVVSTEKLEHCHTLVDEKFAEGLILNVPLGGRISHFLLYWGKLSKDQGNFGNNEGI